MTVRRRGRALHEPKPGTLIWRFGLAVIRRSVSPSLACSKLFVGLDNLLHQVVANDVALVELDEGDAFDASANIQRFDQSRFSPRGQVDLRDVSGDHGLG